MPTPLSIQNPIISGVGATGDQLPHGCVCSHYITVLIPGSSPPGLTRTVCDKIQCNSTPGNPGAGCWVIQVEDHLEICNCPAPAGSTCGEPVGVGLDRYGIVTRTYTWVRCKGISVPNPLGGSSYRPPDNQPSWPEGEVVPIVAESSINIDMPTPLSINPYNSRFNLNTNFNDMQFIYINMTYHGFYGGTSLQSQELNEIQENIQNQLTLANTMLFTYLQYIGNSNTSAMIGYMNNPTLIPVNPI